MPTNSVLNFGNPSSVWNVPPQDVSRQATASLRGYVYQLHASAAAWLGLGPKDELYIEVAEDFAEILREPGSLHEILKATQVKDTRESGTVTLNSSDVLAAIEALNRLRINNPGKAVKLVFLTTSTIGKEKKNALPSGIPGLIAWESAASGGDTDELRAALIQRSLSQELRTFLETSTPDQLRDQLLSPIVFACGAPDWRSIEESNRRTLTERRHEFKSTSDMAHRAYDVVFREIVACALGSAPRCLDGNQLRTCLERSTSIAVPSSIVEDLLGNRSTSTSDILSTEKLYDLAKSLIEIGMPPSIDMLFPSARAIARDALMNIFSVGPRLTEINSEGSPASTQLLELTEFSEKKHLIVGQPGSGKTHALWHTANKLLETGKIVPLYLPAAHATGWNELEEMIKDTAPDVDLTQLFRDPRVCVLVDSWSEFAGTAKAGEKKRALRALRHSRLIATAKFADIDDNAFKHWTLDLLPPAQVERAVTAATPGEAPPSSAVIDLLRLPLLLTIHILTDARSLTTGDLLRQFHEHLMGGLPEHFTEVLAGAVAELSLSQTRSFGRLSSELKTRAAKLNLTDPLRLLRSLGTILERSGQAVPVHDLYWSWLVGQGLLGHPLDKRAIDLLQTRESCALAIQAGCYATEADVMATISEDVVFAAGLDSSRGAICPTASFSNILTQSLNDHRLAVRNRAALAAIQGGYPQFLRPALNVLATLSDAKIYPREWKEILRPEILYEQRSILAEWLGAPNSDFVLDKIAECGGKEWVLWLEQVARDAKVDWPVAAAAALACCNNIPSWVRPHLNTIIALHAWKLRPAATRRGNKELARFIAIEYERLIETVIVNNSSTWLDLNRVLINCGDDEIFYLLLNNFPTMGSRAQELLGYAVVERGSPWISRFQQVALGSGDKQHHKLTEVLSLEIDDETARSWIAGGHDKVGWRVLIARHGEAMLPEMIEQLPASFAGLHYISPLSNMRWFQSAPDSLINEIWSRFGSPMQPMAMQDVLNATARVYPVGVPHIVNFIAAQPNALPGYHLRQSLLLYKEWRKKTGIELCVKASDGTSFTFSDWIVKIVIERPWEECFTSEILASSPELAVDYVLHNIENVKRNESILKALNGKASYNAQLLEYMFLSPTLASLIPQVFAESFEHFPENALQRCIHTCELDQNQLLFRLAARVNSMHKVVHETLIARVLNGAFEANALRYIASFLKPYSREEALNIIEAAPHNREDCWFWFVSWAEIERGERLINEDGSLRRYPH